MMTRAERMSHLNGTGWGVVPETKEEGLDIPFFMTPEYHRNERFRTHNDEARTGAIIGRERQKARQAKDEERRRKQNIVLAAIGVAMLLLVGAVEQGFLF